MKTHTFSIPLVQMEVGEVHKVLYYNLTALGSILVRKTEDLKVKMVKMEPHL
jgi:hypothetical protein